MSTQAKAKSPAKPKAAAAPKAPAKPRPKAVSAPPAPDSDRAFGQPHHGHDSDESSSPSSTPVPSPTESPRTMTETTAKKPETLVETVKMDDGRIVEFAGKRKMLKSTEIADGAVKVRLDFRNGETRLFTIPDAMLLQFAGHGAEQKLGDATAGEAEIDDAILAVDELMDRLAKGDWNARKDAGGMSGTSVLMLALAELYGKPREAIKAFLADKTQAQKLALRANVKVKPIVDRIEQERAAKKTAVNTDELLAGLDTPRADHSS